MTINPETLAEARRLAEEATVGPWHVTGLQLAVGDRRMPSVGGYPFGRDHGAAVIATTEPPYAKQDAEADAAFIAHCNPAFVLEVVREVERLRLVEEALTGWETRQLDDHWSSLERGTGETTEILVQGPHESVVFVEEWIAALANPAAEEPERPHEAYPVPEALREDFHAMIAEMRDPTAGRCTCGFPEKPCLRIMLRNGPPFPARPCEPVSTNPAAEAGE